MSWKRIVPYSFKVKYKLLIRTLKDIKTGDRTKICHLKQRPFFPERISIDQKIKKTHLYENKLVNITEGADRISSVTIQPNEIFSFWSLVKSPSEKNGFKKGRNLMNGVVAESVGGGLCQLAGIIYHLSLTAGLQILERWNHTVDIYKEEDRFTPLGSDATVVYGYKDLRFKNTFSFPLNLMIKIKDDTITASFHAPELIYKQDVVFERTYQEQKVKVTGRLPNGEKVNESSYSLS